MWHDPWVSVLVRDGQARADGQRRSTASLASQRKRPASAAARRGRPPSTEHEPELKSLLQEGFEVHNASNVPDERMHKTDLKLLELVEHIQTKTELRVTERVIDKAYPRSVELRTRCKRAYLMNR